MELDTRDRVVGEDGNDNGSWWRAIERLGAGCARGRDRDVGSDSLCETCSHLLGDGAADEGIVRVEVEEADLDATLVGDDAAPEPVA